MPQAGGQYVYLREPFGAAERLSLRLDAVPGDPDRHHRRGSRRFRQIRRRFRAVDLGAEPSDRQRASSGSPRSSSWPSPWCVLLTVVNMRGIRTGAVVQNVFTFAKIGSLCWAWSRLGFLLGRNPAAHGAQLSAISGAARPGAGTSCAWSVWPWSARCFRPTPGTTSPSPPAKCATRSAICRYRSAWAWAS